MNVYEAIMRAADHIDRNPADYDFMNTRVPECGTSGCLLGWIGLFGGVPVRTHISEVAETMGLADEPSFYRFMHEADAKLHRRGQVWTRDAKHAALLLREVAKRYEQERPHADAFKPWLAALMAKVEGDPIPAEAHS